jgi:hypothetical protein
MTDKKDDIGRWQDGGLTSFSETCFAEYWNELPQNLVLENEAQGDAEANNGVANGVDPYNFKHRMALGKFLIENTGGASMWGDGFGMHWYWGYLAQLDWQWRSGRLADPTIHTNGQIQQEFDIHISMKSWFGYMNLNFSVAVYRGAAKAGLVPDISLRIGGGVTDESEKFNSNPNNVEADPGFIKCVSIWEAFFRGPHATFLLHHGPKRSKKERQPLVDDLYRELWSTHTRIIQASLPHARPLENLMPDFEREFGLGWCHMVELLAAMRFTLLSLDALMEHGAGYLPSLTLDNKYSHEGGMNMTWLLENRKNEYNAAIQMMDLHKATPRKLSFMCGFLRRLCRWEGERQNMPVTMKILTKEGEAGFMKKFFVMGRMMIKVILPKFW